MVTERKIDHRHTSVITMTRPTPPLQYVTSIYPVNCVFRGLKSDLPLGAPSSDNKVSSRQEAARYFLSIEKVRISEITESCQWSLLQLCTLFTDVKKLVICSYIVLK